MKKWYVIYTKHNEELLATQQVRKLGFEVFYPKFRQVKEDENVAGVYRSKVVPLFPSYIFVKIDTARNNWYSIKYTKGVSHIVGASEKSIAPVPEGVVESLMSRVKDGFITFDEPIEEIPDYKAGQPLRIIEGNFTGQIVTHCFSKQNRVTILLSLLSKRVKINLPINAVRPVSPE